MGIKAALGPSLRGGPGWVGEDGKNAITVFGNVVGDACGVEQVMNWWYS